MTSFSDWSRYRDSRDPHINEDLPLVTDLSGPVVDSPKSEAV